MGNLVVAASRSGHVHHVGKKRMGVIGVLAGIPATSHIFVEAFVTGDP